MRNRDDLRVSGLLAGLALLTLLLVSCVGLGETPALAQAEEERPRRVLHVSGSGAVEAAPDRAVVTLGVETEAETAVEAMAENSELMQAVIAAVEAEGVAEADIQTRTLRLRPRHAETAPRVNGPERELVGFRAENLVEVTLRDVDAIGGVLDAALAAGANRVESMRFMASEAAELRSQAREAAWQDAAQKADELAELAGVTLGDVLTIDETTRAPVPVAAERVALEAAVPVQPGTETVQVDLSVTWALD